MGWIYFLGVAVVIVMLTWEHAILRPSDLSRLDVAFFNVNGYVSVIYFAATLTDVRYSTNSPRATMTALPPTSMRSRRSALPTARA